MNITNAVNESVVGDKMEAIFNRQKELMVKYGPMEYASGVVATDKCPVNLNDKYGQAKIKDFSWRVMEELGEALEAYRINDMVHFKEELVDGLHFLVELTINTGIDPFDGIGNDNDKLEYMFNKNRSTLSLANRVSYFVEDIGCMCNCLKNKPWKQSQMLTDISKFTEKLRLVWDSYFRVLTYIFCDSNEVVDTYLKKSQVNKFRQRSNY